ncbi:sarcoplasmic/endoplasmic reticulum calcium ATPase regulator DWORF [Phascolarctos cinereus]
MPLYLKLKAGLGDNSQAARPCPIQTRLAPSRMAEKESTASNLVVPILLLIGWIVGCVVMIYVIFS